MEIKDIDVVLRKGYTNRAVAKEGSNRYETDTIKQYPMYQLEIYKNYFNIDSQDEVVGQLIKDLRDLADYLEQMRNKEKQRKEEREID